MDYILETNSLKLIRILIVGLLKKVAWRQIRQKALSKRLLRLFKYLVLDAKQLFDDRIVTFLCLTSERGTFKGLF